ncbi:MAG: serpin family protein [Clostridia bacterium]|nr:serpin family protein [Clostridia bacterium]
MKKALSILLIFTMALCMFSCGKNPNLADTTNSINETTVSTLKENGTEQTTQRVGGQVCLGTDGKPMYIRYKTADFAFRLFKEAVKGEANALISPVSVIMALAMTANGAKGETLEQIEAVLGLDVASLNADYTKQIFDGNGIKLANSVWLRNERNRLTVNESFVQTVQSRYGADVFSEKFNKKTLDKINAWVSDNTDGLIKNMLNEIPEDAVIYLINTVLFDAEWQNPYSRGDIRENQIFTTESGEKQTVTMLRSEQSDLTLFRLGKAQGVEIPYNNGYSFAAILPDEGVTVEQALQSFTGDDFVKAVAPEEPPVVCGTYCPVEILLPKFEFDCSFNLNDALKSLGMPAAFDSAKADFSGMATSTRGNIYIGNVYHNTKIALTEKGTIAGAATAVEFVEEGMMIYNQTMRFDRPFIYVIYETETGTPLFVGAVKDFNE